MIKVPQKLLYHNVGLDFFFFFFFFHETNSHLGFNALIPHKRTWVSSQNSIAIREVVHACYKNCRVSRWCAFLSSLFLDQILISCWSNMVPLPMKLTKVSIKNWSKNGEPKGSSILKNHVENLMIGDFRIFYIFMK